jgi:hypothetical protein
VRAFFDVDLDVTVRLDATPLFVVALVWSTQLSVPTVLVPDRGVSVHVRNVERLDEATVRDAANAGVAPSPMTERRATTTRPLALGDLVG